MYTSTSKDLQILSPGQMSAFVVYRTVTNEGQIYFLEWAVHNIEHIPLSTMLGRNTGSYTGGLAGCTMHICHLDLLFFLFRK